MLSKKDIEMLYVSINDKLDALVNVLLKIEDADDILEDVVYGHVPFSQNEAWQDEADQFFWHSEGMGEINDVALAIGKLRDLTRHAIHVLENSTQA